MSSLKSNSSLYDAYYFRHCCGEPYGRTPEWLTLFAGFAEGIVHKIKPHTVLDAGCAMGFLVEALRQRSIQAWGLDVSEYAIERVSQDVQPFCSVGSVTKPLDRNYDLIVCIEVLEHLTPREAEQAIENFCRHSDDVLFSSTPFDYKEATHLNVQPIEHWAELFAQNGLFRDVDFDASFVTPWAVRFRRKNEPMHRLVREYERKFWRLWKENSDLRLLTIEMRNQLAQHGQD